MKRITLVVGLLLSAVSLRAQVSLDGPGAGVFGAAASTAAPVGGGTNSPAWVTIETNGWVADVFIAGMTTNGTYNYGLGPSNSLTGAESLKITLTSPGFDDTGASNNLTRTVVGTKRLRYPYPNQANAYEYLSGSGVVLRVALSDYIHANDTISGAAIASGFYTGGAMTNYATNLTATVSNYSGATVPRVLAMWSQPGYFTVGSNYNLSLVAFHYSGVNATQPGRPVRAVQFWAVDGAGNRSPTNTVLNPIIDGTQTDAVPVIEYTTTIDGSGFAQGSTISNYAKVFPWYGKALDFSDGVNPPASADYTALITYCDKSNVWPRVYALVDVTNGVTATGKAVTNATQALDGTAKPYATLADAINACGATNNAIYGTNSYENCYVWATNGDYAVFGGANITSRNAGKPWLTIGARPDVDWRKVKFSSKNNSQTGDKTVKIRFFNAVLAVSANANTLDQGYGNVLIEGSEIWTNLNDVSVATFVTNLWLKTTVIKGMRTFPNPIAGNLQNAWAKVRGCRFDSFDSAAGAHTTTINPVLLIGNNFIPFTNALYSIANDVTDNTDPVIWAFNRCMNGDEAVYQLKLGIGTNINVGAALVQNVLETQKRGASIPLDVMFSDRDNEWCTNVLIWNNTIIAKYHEPFNLSGRTSVSSDHYQQANNIFASREISLDVNTSNGNATNRWAQLFSVGSFNNSSAQIGLAGGSTVGTDPAGTELGFDGVASSYDVTTNAISFKFVDNRAWCGGNSNGLGDYHLQSTSPLLSTYLRGVVLLPYDIAGSARNATNPPGAYVYP